MDKLDGQLIDPDVLVVGAGAGGLMAALSAKRNGPPGTRVTLVDSWLIGRTGSPLAPAWYMSAAMVLGIGAMLAMRETAPVKARG